MCDPLTAAALTTTASSAAATTAATTAATVGTIGAISEGVAGASGIAAGLAPSLAAPLASFVGSGIADIGGAGAIGQSIAGGLASAEAGVSGLNFARMFNLGSTIFNTGGALMQGIGGMKEKNYEAKQLDANAKARVAGATQEMQVEGRNMDLAISKARNTGAAGGGALDPSVVNILGDYEKQGARNEANTLDNANSSGFNMEAQAGADRFMAGQSLAGGEIGAVSSLFSGLGKTMSAKYGADTSTYGYA